MINHPFQAYHLKNIHQNLYLSWARFSHEADKIIRNQDEIGLNIKIS